ncbi:hypothetical protein [Corynebacterium sp. H130]
MEFFALPAAEQAEFDRLTAIFEVEEEHVLDPSYLLPIIHSS